MVGRPLNLSACAVSSTNTKNKREVQEEEEEKETEEVREEEDCHHHQTRIPPKMQAMTQKIVQRGTMFCATLNLKELLNKQILSASVTDAAILI